jgi:hypothetical protein
VADVDGVSKLDLLLGNLFDTIGNEIGTVGVLLGNGDGTFQTAVSYGSGGRRAEAVEPADVNGDGKPDIVVANCSSIGICAKSSGEVGVLVNISPSPYKARVQPPINADNTSVFKANRGVIPVKFTLTQNNAATCTLPPATISVTRTAGGVIGSVDEGSYSMAADNGSNFRIDSCQYVYNLDAKSLGVGTIAET